MTPLVFSRLLAASTLAVGLLAPLTASAKTCNADSECNANQKCEIVGSSGFEGCPPCPPGGTCEPCATPEPTTITECVDQPIACATDADCPSYLACIAESSPDVACPACDPGPGGECPPCAPPAPPSGKKFCSYVERTCTANADCGAGFSCETSEVGGCGAPTPACAPGEECPAEPKPPCTSEQIGRCTLQIVECKQNSDCAKDFSCETVSEGSCASTGSGTREPNEVPPSSGGGTPAPSPPNPSPAPQDGGAPPGGDCVTTTRQVCIPKGVGFGSASDSAAGIPRAEGEATGTGKGNTLGGNPQGANTEGAPSAGTSDDGCTTAAPGQKSGAAWSILLLAAGLVGLGKRRRLA